LTLDSSGRITSEEKELIKHLDKFEKDEGFLQKFFDQFTNLEKRILKDIQIVQE
jgi:hypothetical protein